jgi:hypothetical protein
MEDFSSQIAEFASPFPSKIFEQELDNAYIKYRSHNKSSGDGGLDSTIFFVNSKDFDEAFQLKEKVDKENAESELKHIHPARKILSYFFLFTIIVYIIYKFFF